MKEKTSHIARSAADLGRIARTYRKPQGTIKQTAPLLNLGTRFISEVERGKPSAELGKVIQLLDGIGLSLLVVPKSQAAEIDRRLETMGLAALKATSKMTARGTVTKGNSDD